MDGLADRHLDLLEDTDWAWLTAVADPFVTAALFAAGFLVLRRRSPRTQQAWAWVVAVVIGLIVEVVCKAWVDQIPFAPVERIFDVVSLTNSYPSGHAMRAVLLQAGHRGDAGVVVDVICGLCGRLGGGQRHASGIRCCRRRAARRDAGDRGQLHRTRLLVVARGAGVVDSPGEFSGPSAATRPASFPAFTAAAVDTIWGTRIRFRRGRHVGLHDLRRAGR